MAVTFHYGSYQFPSGTRWRGPSRDATRNTFNNRLANHEIWTFEVPLTGGSWTAVNTAIASLESAIATDGQNLEIKDGGTVVRSMTRHSVNGTTDAQTPRVLRLTIPETVPLSTSVIATVVFTNKLPNAVTSVTKTDSIEIGDIRKRISLTGEGLRAVTLSISLTGYPQTGKQPLISRAISTINDALSAGSVTAQGIQSLEVDDDRIQNRISVAVKYLEHGNAEDLIHYDETLSINADMNIRGVYLPGGGIFRWKAGEPHLRIQHNITQAGLKERPALRGPLDSWKDYTTGMNVTYGTPTITSSRDAINFSTQETYVYEHVPSTTVEADIDAVVETLATTPISEFGLLDVGDTLHELISDNA